MNGWLPLMIDYNAYAGRWDDFERAVYSVFKRDFLDSKPVLSGHPVIVTKYPIYRGMEQGFWHLVTENVQGMGDREEDRVMDIARGKRIGWIRAIMERYGSEVIYTWEKDHRRPGGKTDRRLLMALKDYSYVIIVAYKSIHALLITAYPVEQEHRRRKLQREHKDEERGR